MISGEFEKTSQEHSYYRDLGKRVLEIIAPPDRLEAPLELSCRPESIGMFVETVVNSGLRKAVGALDPEELIVGRIIESDNKEITIPGEALLRMRIQEHLPYYEIHRANRSDLARLTAALNAEGLWDEVANAVESAVEAEVYRSFERKRDEERRTHERREAWEALDKSSFPPLRPPTISGIAMASVSELEHAVSWLTQTAQRIVASGSGIPQNLTRSLLFDEINGELCELKGKTLEDKMDGFSRLLHRVEMSLTIAKELSDDTREKTRDEDPQALMSEFMK